MTLTRVATIGLTLFITSCQTVVHEVNELLLFEDFSFYQFQDSSYLNSVYSIIEEEGKVYLLDNERNQVMVVNEDGVHLQTIGHQGRGPGELLGGGQMFLTNDSLFVYSAGKQAFDLFSNGQYLNTFNMAQMEGQYSGGRFFAASGSAVLSTPTIHGSISKVPFANPGVANFFGRIIEFSSSRQTGYQNERHVFSYGNSIFAIPRSIPLIEKYTKDGKLIETLSLEQLPLMEEIVAYARSLLPDERVVVPMFSDAYLKDDCIFILTTLRCSKTERTTRNTILVINIGGKKMELGKIIKLNEGRHHTIAVSDNYIWTFCSKPIERYVARFPYPLSSR